MARYLKKQVVVDAVQWLKPARTIPANRTFSLNSIRLPA